MDAFMYNADPYRRVSAGSYALSYPPLYALEGRSAFGLASADPLAPYARLPVDPLAGYGVPRIYETDSLLPSAEYMSRRTSTFRPPTSAPINSAARQNLGPKKRPFKQTQKVRFSEEKEAASKVQTGKKGGKIVANASPASQSNSRMQEAKQLHVLFRTGGGKTEGETEAKVSAANGIAKKRKADTQAKRKSGNKQKGKKKKKLLKKKKAKTTLTEFAPLTEEQMKEVEAGLDMQKGLCKSVTEFLGLSEVIQTVATAEAEQDKSLEDSMRPDNDSKETENDGKEIETKPVEPPRSPEEEKEAEAKSLKFFAGLFADHPELRNLYIDKCHSGSFECLVCNSVDATRRKNFWSVVFLVTHTKMVQRLRPEHSGYGRAVSAVLGWDHSKIPKVPAGAHRPVALSGNRAEADKEKGRELGTTAEGGNGN